MTSINTFKLLLTAAEALPALEREVLAADRSIRASFRVFDLGTALRTDEGRATGETWFDLLRHVLARGVEIDLFLTDFDPIVATPEHRMSWRAARKFAAVRELPGGEGFRYRVAAHPARVGAIPRLALSGKVREQLDETQNDELTPGLDEVDKGGSYDLVPATHHQKLAVFDDERLYIGGLDLDERRYDSKDHDRRAAQTWADVQVLVTGPVVAAATEHLKSFEDVAAGKADAPERAPGFIRTISTRRGFAALAISPKPLICEIEECHLDAIGRSKGLIYMETQFFRHLPIAEALADAAKDNPDLRLLMVLPGAPEDVAFLGGTGEDSRFGEYRQVQCVETVIDAFGPRALFASPVQPGVKADEQGPNVLAGAPIVYVHSKVALFGLDEAIVSSANLNGRSLRWDTEAGVHIEMREHIEELRRRLLAHWLPRSDLPDPTVDTQEIELFEAAKASIERNLRLPPEARKDFLVPYDLVRPRKFGENLPLVPPEVV